MKVVHKYISWGDGTIACTDKAYLKRDGANYRWPGVTCRKCLAKKSDPRAR
jgi:hypothetical protein